MGTDPILGILIFGIVGLLIYMHFKKLSFKDIWEKLRGLQ